MYKLLLDSDALIKISKAEFLDAVAENFNVAVTEEVYYETVIEGKKGFYQDADNIDKLVQSGKIKIRIGRGYRKKKKPKQSFGIGEASVLQAYQKGSLIVTDDLSFTAYMEKEQIKSISSAHLLLALVKKKKVKKDKARYCLEKLRYLIRKEVYELIRKDIEGD